MSSVSVRMTAAPISNNHFGDGNPKPIYEQDFRFPRERTIHKQEAVDKTK